VVALSLPPVHDAVLNEEIGRAGAPDAPRVGYLARAILEYGTEDQRKKYVPRLLSGEDYWCQGFSEPDAGSDLANVMTRAERRDDAYSIRGQKVWTSYADYADFCLVLARTGDSGSRHKGISAFIVPMDSVGVLVRPLVANTGEAEFSELFFSDVTVAESGRLGEEGQGWSIAMMTVSYERGAADIGYLSKYGAAIGALRREAGDSIRSDQHAAALIGSLEVQYGVLQYHIRRRMLEREGSAELPGPETSVDKMLMTMTEQTIYNAALDLLGASPFAGVQGDEWVRRYLYSRAASIYGGSQQIQYNILAQRVLGLPAAVV
jgi:alkylation response protein AidB-like acyl-CoA dehydrogenase